MLIKDGQPNLVKCNGHIRQGIDTITGEALRIDGNDLVQRFNGKEVGLHLDANSQITGNQWSSDRIDLRRKWTM